jgi:hypothetical protein
MSTYRVRHIAIGVGRHSVDDGRESCGRRGIGTDCCRRVDILEESERGRGDGQRTNLLPLIDCIVELLSGRESGEIPVINASMKVRVIVKRSPYHGLPL